MFEINFSPRQRGTHKEVHNKNTELHVTVNVTVFIFFGADSYQNCVWLVLVHLLWEIDSVNFFFWYSDTSSVIPLYNNDNQNFEFTLDQWWALWPCIYNVYCDFSSLFHWVPYVTWYLRWYVANDVRGQLTRKYFLPSNNKSIVLIFSSPFYKIGSSWMYFFNRLKISFWD